ncbi:MAG: exopolysaccharide biosynthesis polyprenyl glycosylphosphotransferase [Candidatus Saccharimonadales bacterium]
MKNNASLVYSISLVVGDFLALVAAFLAGYGLRAASSSPVHHPIPVHTFINTFLLVLPFWILVFALVGLYNSNIYERRFSELPRLFVGSFIGLTFLIFLDFISVKPLFPAKLVPIYGFALAFIFLVVYRNLARLIRSQLFGYAIGLNRVLIVGNTEMSRQLINALTNTRHSGYKIVAVVGGKLALGNHNLALYANFIQFLREHPEPNLHSILQTELYVDESRNTEILTYAQEHHATYRFVPGNSELFVGNVKVELFQGSTPVITVNQTALLGWGKVVKRIFDLVIGTLLFIIAIPVIAIISLLMIVFDHGDPIFTQARLSRFGEIIQIYKFRTQLHSYHRMTPEEGFAKMGRSELAKRYRQNGDFLEDDPRLSRLGRFLRRTSLDELPQLLNVLKGEMSLVGPRPLEPFELDNYDKKNLMLSVKTGLTGLAVVSGRRIISFEDRRQLDLYYVQNWSFWLDLVILFKTVSAVVSRKGAQ